MVSFWIVIAIMAPVALFGIVTVLLIAGFDRSVDDELHPKDEGDRWINIL